ncbi:hypothetical protein BH10BAC5_BH10BAC5_27740 [soil metagenome]
MKTLLISILVISCMLQSCGYTTSQKASSVNIKSLLTQLSSSVLLRQDHFNKSLEIASDQVMIKAKQTDLLNAVVAIKTYDLYPEGTKIKGLLIEGLKADTAISRQFGEYLTDHNDAITKRYRLEEMKLKDSEISIECYTLLKTEVDKYANVVNY